MNPLSQDQYNRLLAEGKHSREELDEYQRQAYQYQESLRKGREIQGTDEAERISQIYREVLGRDADVSGLGAYAGKDIFEIYDALRSSREHVATKQMPELLDKAQEWESEGWGLGEEFSASSGGEYVLVREGQKMAGEYQDLTDSYGDLVPEGYRMYFDQGRGGGGLLGALANWTGVKEFDEEGSLLQRASLISAGIASLGAGTLGAGLIMRGVGVSEGAPMIDLSTANLGTRLIGGAEMHADTTRYSQEHLGLQEGELDKYADMTTLGVSSVVAAYVPILWWLPAAVAAAQGTSKKVGGTGYERRNTEWSDIAESAAWSAAGGYASGWGGVAIGAARAKSQGGGTWGDAAVAGAVGAAGLGAGDSPELRAIVSGGGGWLQGGTWEDAAVAAGASYAGSTVGSSFKNPDTGRAAAALASGAVRYAFRDGEYGVNEERSLMIETGLQALSGYLDRSGRPVKGPAPLSPDRYRPDFDAMRFDRSSSWVNNRLYNPNVYGDERRWFNPNPQSEYVTDARGNRVSTPSGRLPSSYSGWRPPDEEWVRTRTTDGKAFVWSPQQVPYMSEENRRILKEGVGLQGDTMRTTYQPALGY